MTQKLTYQTLETILQAVNVESIPFPKLLKFFYEEKGIAEYIPDGICQVDPRNGDRIVYSSARAQRPHDNIPESLEINSENLEKDCVICQGLTTGVIDVADLSEGFTFINKNLFPILFPFEGQKLYPPDLVGEAPRAHGKAAHGFHFLQWTSSYHDKDWHNMKQKDCIIVMNRLAALEKKLITDSGSVMPVTELEGVRGDHRGFVSIVKNYGRLVGGSLAHGHQQIGFSNVIPRRFIDNWHFYQTHGLTFSAYLLEENPSDLLIWDYGPAVLLVPYFMRRPYDIYLLVRNVNKQHLFELDENETTAVAQGWHDAISFLMYIMPKIGRETAYNVIVNNGPGAGIYFEFLPYTQETGGFEHLGLLLCQGNPRMVAEDVRDFLDIDTLNRTSI